jgi:hypothetical protein
MIRLLLTYRSIGRLAISLLLLVSLQAALSASAAQGARLFVELSAAPGGTTAPHDHSTTVCHSCPGHICLEQHGAADQASGPPVLLAAAAIAIEPWPAAEAWAHPPTAPPAAAFIHFVSLPRAPPRLS